MRIIPGATNVIEIITFDKNKRRNLHWGVYEDTFTGKVDLGCKLNVRSEG